MKAKHKKHSARLWYALLPVLVGAVFRLCLLSVDVRFHPDEAFFAAFARNAAVRGEWLLPGNLDKTPGAIYGQALMMLLVGIQWDGAVWRLDVFQGEFAARLWSMYASILIIALTYRFARILGKSGRGAAITAWLMALSPYGIAFSATAFTDSPMLLFVLFALLMAVRGRAVSSGLFLMLGYATKQQAIIFLPLVFSLLYINSSQRQSWQLIRFIGSMAAVWLCLWLWDTARPFPSVFALAAANNTPEHALIAPNELLPRLGAWLPFALVIFGGLGTILVVGVLPLTHNTLQVSSTTVAILFFVIGYALLHVIVPINIYDRYVLPLVPLLAVLMVPRHPRRFVWLIPILMLPSAWNAATIHPLIGGDRGQHDGITDVAAYLNNREFGAIVYDRWLGWELDYYLGGWSNKRRAYYPTPTAMTTDPAFFVPDTAPRYLPAPVHIDMADWFRAWAKVGVEVCVGYTSPNFRVYVLTNPASDGEFFATDLEPTACPNQGAGSG